MWNGRRPEKLLEVSQEGWVSGESQWPVFYPMIRNCRATGHYTNLTCSTTIQTRQIFFSSTGERWS